MVRCEDGSVHREGGDEQDPAGTKALQNALGPEWMEVIRKANKEHDEEEKAEPRMTVLLHMPWNGEPIPWDDDGNLPPSTLAQPKIFRTEQLTRPINAVAKRVSRPGEGGVCEFCRRWFRSSAAMKLHIEETHADELERQTHEPPAPPRHCDPRLTERQNEIVEFISDYIAIHGHGPSNPEISDAMGVNLSGIQKHLNNLRGAGVLTWTEGRERAETLTVTDYGASETHGSAEASLPSPRTTEGEAVELDTPHQESKTRRPRNKRRANARHDPAETNHAAATEVCERGADADLHDGEHVDESIDPLAEFEWLP